MTPFLSAYFARLGWTGTPDVSIETLRSLHIPVSYTHLTLPTICSV